MDPTSALLLYVLFYATEKVIGHAGGKIADALSKPIWEALEDKAKWLAGQDETAKRWQAFSRAFDEAKTRFVETPPDPELAARLEKILDMSGTRRRADRYLLEQMAAELEKASLLSEQPNVEAIARLCLAVFQRQGDPPPPQAELTETIKQFVIAFQERLFAQSAYSELMLKQAQWQQLRQPRTDTHARYLAQVIDRYQDLDFVGIPELKDRQAMHIEDIFINLQAEVEVEPDTAPMMDMEASGEFMQKVSGSYASSTRIMPSDDYDIDVDLVVEATELDKAQFAQRAGRVSRKIIKRRLALDTAMKEYPKMVILGGPGAGKTTLLKHIILAFAEDQSDRLGLAEERLPIFVRLYDYVAKRAKRSGNYSLVDYLYTQAHENLMLDLPPGFFEEALAQGRCCVCLDGLDELGEAGLRREVTVMVASLTSRYPRNRYIVSSRLVGYQEAPLDRRAFVHHTVLPFSDDDIERFVQKWYQAREKDPVRAGEQIKHLTDTIMAEPRIKALATNPLMLTIIALVHRIEAELPHERVKLYDKCVTALIDTWEQVKRITAADRERPYYKKRRQLLEQLAYWLHTQPLAGTAGRGRAREVEEGDLKARLVKFLLADPNLKLDRRAAWQETGDFIKMAKARTGLLVERGDQVYSFAHLTFQEFLAAEYIKYEYAHSIDEIWVEMKPPRLHARTGVRSSCCSWAA